MGDAVDDNDVEKEEGSWESNERNGAFVAIFFCNVTFYHIFYVV